MNGKREYGDYQTPEFFSLAVCKFLREQRKLKPSVIIEPTCGVGSFVKSSLIFEASEIIGIEVNPDYCKRCIQDIRDPRVQIINADFFSFDLKSLIKGKDELLIVGNPPWINNSTLSVLNSDNTPLKSNIKGLKGMDALTGASNFDICEYIILQLIASLQNTNATIAMLCKTSVARNLFTEMKRIHTRLKSCDIFEFNAYKVFGINASACLLVIELCKENVSAEYCNVYSFDKPNEMKNAFGYVNGTLFSEKTKEVADFSGNCTFEWRQGVKHDCSKVMELSKQGTALVNGLKETVSIESEYVFPLIKSSMFKSPIINSSDKYVIVTQKKVREDTSHIETDAPKTWAYLTSHKELFLKRKSTIYKDSPDYSMFGIGDYSYARYKVGVSGFYKKPLFSVITSDDDKPVMTDDTSYFICFPTYGTAYTAMLILNSEIVQRFLLSIAFLDAKRPFTKKVLEQIDFQKILRVISVSDLAYTERQLGLRHIFNEMMLEEFKLLPELCQESLMMYA
ncbi:MAG: hypothetical protein PUB99_08620 [Oscillospiraceae bacterium]|nr:hypothetical protein [Oscillospiraceae bacterium]